MDWTGWAQVSSGTLENATDLRNIAGALTLDSSPVDGIRLVLTAPQGWPFWASAASLGATVSGNDMIREWSSLPGTPLLAATEIASPAFAAAVQDTIMTSGPITWTLYQHQPSGIQLPSIQLPNIKIPDIQLPDVKMDIPWVPILIVGGLILLLR